jgi:hypothetical protein
MTYPILFFTFAAYLLVLAAWIAVTDGRCGRRGPDARRPDTRSGSRNSIRGCK